MYQAWRLGLRRHINKWHVAPQLLAGGKPSSALKFLLKCRKQYLIQSANMQIRIPQVLNSSGSQIVCV